MGGTFVITLREGFEAALILGIVYTYLQKIGAQRHYRYATRGGVLGVLASIALGVVVTALSGPLLDLGPDIIGLAVIFVAVVVLTWHGYWMRQHARAMLTASRDHGRALTDERTRNAAVVDTLRARVADAGTLIEKQRVTIAELKMRVSGLKGDKAYLRAEVDHRESVITSLRVTVRAREAELIALRDEPDAEVHTMPRRVFTEPEPAADALPTAEDLWTDGSHPTVVDLKTIDTAMVLPNYEVDRRVG